MEIRRVFKSLSYWLLYVPKSAGDILLYILHSEFTRTTSHILTKDRIPPCRRSPPQTQCCLVNQLHVMSSCKRYAKHLRKCAHILLGNIYSIDLYELYQYQSFFNDVYVFIHIYTAFHILIQNSTSIVLYPQIILPQIYTSPTNVLKGPLRCTPRSNESNCFFQIASVYICLADKQK